MKMQGPRMKIGVFPQSPGHENPSNEGNVTSLKFFDRLMRKTKNSKFHCLQRLSAKMQRYEERNPPKSLAGEVPGIIKHALIKKKKKKKLNIA